MSARQRRHGGAGLRRKVRSGGRPRDTPESILGGALAFDFDPSRNGPTTPIPILYNLAGPADDVTQGTESQQPDLSTKDGYPTARFAKADNQALYHIGGAQFAAAGVYPTLWVVTSMVTAATNQTIIESTNAAGGLYRGCAIQVNSDNLFAYVRAGGALRSASISNFHDPLNTSRHLLRQTCTATEMSIRVDEGTPATWAGDAALDEAQASLFLGAYAANPPVGNWADMHLERVIGAVNPTAAQIAAVTALLQSRYGL